MSSRGQDECAPAKVPFSAFFIFYLYKGQSFSVAFVTPRSRLAFNMHFSLYCCFRFGYICILIIGSSI